MVLSFHIVWTIIMLVLFIGIFYWAWNDRRKDDFDEASRLPLEGELDGIPEKLNSSSITNRQERNHNG